MGWGMRREGRVRWGCSGAFEELWSVGSLRRWCWWRWVVVLVVPWVMWEHLSG